MRHRTTTILTIAAASALTVLFVCLANIHNMTSGRQRDILYPTPSMITAKSIGGRVKGSGPIVFGTDVASRAIVSDAELICDSFDAEE